MVHYHSSGISIETNLEQREYIVILYFYNYELKKQIRIEYIPFSFYDLTLLMNYIISFYQLNSDYQYKHIEDINLLLVCSSLCNNYQSPNCTVNEETDTIVTNKGKNNQLVKFDPPCNYHERSYESSINYDMLIDAKTHQMHEMFTSDIYSRKIVKTKRLIASFIPLINRKDNSLVIVFEIDGSLVDKKFDYDSYEELLQAITKLNILTMTSSVEELNSGLIYLPDDYKIESIGKESPRKMQRKLGDIT